VLPAAIDYARDLARTCSPRSMATIKRQVLNDWTETLEAAQRSARGLMHEHRLQSDFREGVQSFVERRQPSFDPYAEPLDPAAFALES
jgi:enoyl-CoA hydratase/carnithine racemase